MTNVKENTHHTISYGVMTKNFRMTVKFTMVYGKFIMRKRNLLL
jgi:hypothetical protein